MSIATQMQPYLQMQPNISFAPESQNFPSLNRQSDPSEGHSPVLVGKSVVVVEDEGVTQMQLRRMLKNAGLNVAASATNGEQGVEAVLRERPDLVLMDIRMPGSIDGLEAAKRILAEYAVCIIILTAFSDEEYRKQAEDLNVCGYVLKPITTETLLPRIENAMRNFRPQ
jgi:two-component system, response regulator PdtaR